MPPATSAIAPATAISQVDVATIHLRFLESVQRDLRLSVARVRAYLVGNANVNTNGSGSGDDAEEVREGDERTAQILLDHVVDRILGSYERWSEAVRRFGRGGAGPADVDILNAARLKEMLRDVCGNTDGFGDVYYRGGDEKT